MDDVGFTNRSARNYRLTPESPYKNAATDGTDIGANIDAMQGAPASDPIAPVVVITSPRGPVSGTVTVTVTAHDNTGVVGVDILVDGVHVGSDTSAPYAVSWNTASVPNGVHKLTAVARDRAGNVGTSAPVVVMVQNR